MRLKKTDLILTNLQQDLLSLEQKRQLLTLITEPKQLEKLSKQLAEPLASELKLHLQQQQEAKDKPVQLRKVVNLLLAKFNAVRERGDLTQMQQKWQQYQQEWDAVQSDLALLDDAVELTQKYEKIKVLTENAWAPLRKEQQQQLAQQQKIVALQQQQQQFENQLQAMQQQLSELMSEGRLDETDPLAAEAATLLQKISQSELAAGVKSGLQKALATFERQLQQLPAQAEQLFKLTRLLADWSSAVVPEGAVQFQHIEAKYQQWQQEWSKGRKALGAMLPESLAQAQHQLNAQWQPLMSEFAAQTEKILNRCALSSLNSGVYMKQGVTKCCLACSKAFNKVTPSLVWLSNNNWQKIIRLLNSNYSSSMSSKTILRHLASRNWLHKCKLWL